VFAMHGGGQVRRYDTRGPPCRRRARARPPTVQLRFRRRRAALHHVGPQTAAAPPNWRGSHFSGSIFAVETDTAGVDVSPFRA